MLTVEKLREQERQRTPEWIMGMLPEADRDRFVREYRAAAHVASEDPARYSDLRQLLHRWWLLATAMADPGYAEAEAEAEELVRTGHGGVSLEEVVRRYHAHQQAQA